MPAKSTGSVYWSRGKPYAKVWLGKGKRPTLHLVGCDSPEDAETRRQELAEAAAILREHEQADEIGVQLLKKLAAGDKRAGELIDRIGAGARVTAKQAPGMTFRDLGEMWTSGKLADRYKDHVTAKATASDDVGRLETHVYPLVQHIRIKDFNLDHAEAVMASLPAKLAPATRRHVAQVIHRLMAMAVFPLRLIEASPVPRGWLPKIGKGRISDPPYPAEHDTLLGHTKIPLCYRVLFGFMAREGMRASEAAMLTWSDLNLRDGIVQLDENKTDDPRSWTMGPDVAAALRLWRRLRPGKSAHVFVNEDGVPLLVWKTRRGGHKKPELGIRASRYRAWLKSAGVCRAALSAKTDVRRPTRIHDLRGLFVTSALASGKTETWVMDRTGHTTSGQLNNYRRRARSWAEAKMPQMAPLTTALPELRVIDVSAEVSAASDVQLAQEA